MLLCVVVVGGGGGGGGCVCCCCCCIYSFTVVVCVCVCVSFLLLLSSIVFLEVTFHVCYSIWDFSPLVVSIPGLSRGVRNNCESEVEGITCASDSAATMMCTAARQSARRFTRV